MNKLWGMFTIAALVAGCDQSNQETSRQPNPAAVYCEKQGGQYDFDSGQCTLANGEVVDAWDYYRETLEKKVGLPNPAAVYCEAQGQYNTQSGECTLEDGSVVDAWEWFREQHKSK
ncbi:DUF333 domain-containing protein [Gilvimarinus sp. DA14]|uniref:DUF333 domain-containing protein n=1 Tax=Gilvimarinus sp. DA14 TaxID=2956798 RepID=UPI0020B80C1B|nr:DUF333 domain-containing protein [Gilvimarinus sp. DA14]UTF61478.1 DUF333 domain-containing protein [Gilvimarinus sp. DA14]